MPPEMTEHETKCPGVDRTGKANSHAASLEFDHARQRRGAGPTRHLRRRRSDLSDWSCILNPERDEGFVARLPLSHRRPPPGLQQPTVDPRAACQIRDVHSGLQAFGHERRFFCRSPPTPAGNTRDQLDPAILSTIVPVLMHGIIPTNPSRPTRANRREH